MVEGDKISAHSKGQLGENEEKETQTPTVVWLG